MIEERRVDDLRVRLAKEPEFAAVINALWYRSVRERCEDLPVDQRHQALDHLDALIDLLSTENDEDEEGELA